MKELPTTSKELEEATNPLFLVIIEITNGENEYIIYRVARAISWEEARNQARIYLSDFWGSYTKPDADNPDRFWTIDDGQSIALNGIEQITPDQLIQRLELKPLAKP
jgi:hypothetical protein